MAGEWELEGDNDEHDGLRQLFLFFVDNRDVSKDGQTPGMKVRLSRILWLGADVFSCLCRSVTGLTPIIPPCTC